MIKATLRAGLAVMLLGSVTAEAASVPSAGPRDPRIRIATYNPDQVYQIETDLLHATTIHLGVGEQFVAVIAGDTRSFNIQPIVPAGNVLSIKPTVQDARTNMTVLTTRRTYSFALAEGSRDGEFFDVRFRYPNDERRSSNFFGKSGFQPPKNFNYQVAGSGDFRPMRIWDDGRHTYFVFPENARRPAIFRADAEGRERSVNSTQQGNAVRILGVNDYWTLRIGDQEICVRRDTTRIVRDS